MGAISQAACRARQVQAEPGGQGQRGQRAQARAQLFARGRAVFGAGSSAPSQEEELSDIGKSCK
ncbi:hypothetical protein LP420_07315 [Massilia sp. B-10]|nr:hypothetical protein LP420_07315 [Massilia sp. B-10]